MRGPAIGFEVLAMVGRDETLNDGATIGERLRQRLPRARVRLLDDASHLVFIDQRDAVADELRKFRGP